MTTNRNRSNDIVTLQDQFYCDSAGKVWFAIVSAGVLLLCMLALSIYLYRDQPPPITFKVEKEMRVLGSVPLSDPYLTSPEVLQWVTDVFMNVFTLDFNHYNAQLKRNSQSFTADGWKAFLNYLNTYANYNNVQAYKLFVNSSPAAAPIIDNQAVISESGKYGWWVRVPVNINYAGYKPPQNTTITFLVLVVRVSTLNNLNGVAIENVVQAPPAPEGNRNG